MSGPYLWNRYSQRHQIECAAWSCGLILHCCLPSNSLRYWTKVRGIAPRSHTGRPRTCLVVINFNIVSLHINIIIIVPFVSFTLFIFSFFLLFLLSLVFSPFSLPLSRFLFVSLCFLLSFSFFVSFYCFSFFFLALPSVVWFSLHFRFLFLPPSLLPSFPYLSLLFVPVVGLSSFFSSPSLAFFLLFSVNFRLRLSFRCFLFLLSRNFSLPRSSPFLSLSLLFHFLLNLLPFGLTSLLFAVFLFDVFLFPLSLLSLFSSFFSVSFCFFFCVFSSLFLSPPPLLPSFCFLDIFLFCFLGFVLFLCLTPSSFFSSASLSRFSFCFFLLRFLPLMSPLSVRLLFVLLLASSPSSSPGFRSSSSSVSPPLHAYSSLSVSASRWFSSAHPLVCLACLAGWPASIFFSSSSSLFLLFSWGFRFLFSFVGTCLVFLIACALVLCIGGFC